MSAVESEVPRAAALPVPAGPAGRLLAGAGAGLILLMVAVTCIDVVGRYLFNRPFGGAFEITQMALAGLVFVALPLTTRAGAHVEVDLALHLLPIRARRLLARFAAVLVALALLVFALQLARLGLQQIAIGARTASLGLPLAPLAFFGAASCVLSAVLAVPRSA